MNNKTACIRILAVLLSAMLLFSGCTRPTVADAEISDAPEIRIETEEPPPPPITEEPATAALTEPVTSPAVIHTTALITETAAPVITETETEPITAPAYAVVPRMASRPFAEVREQLDAAGVSYTVTEAYSAQQAAGHVITVQFHGTLDKENCHINREYPVAVTVSLGKRTRTNVTAADPKRIYLTFDDGPHHNTDRVLEILEEYGAKATFFTLGTYVAVYPERTKAICDSGHLLACHSYFHDYMKLYESAESTLNEIHAWEAAVEKAGVALPQTVYFRFPGGSTTNYMARDRYEEIFWAITDAGYYAMDWTCANNDRYLNGMKEDQTLVDYLLESTAVTLNSLSWSPTTPRIMLMHDTADETVEALPQILEYLIDEGYTFGTLDELDGYWVFH